MKVWQNLYAIIWLMLLEILFQSKAIDFQGVKYVHVLLGVLILAMAFNNYINVNKTAAPDRTKRILRTAANFAVVQAVLGVIIVTTDVYNLFGICQMGIVQFLHLVIAIAMITQAASGATSYDMWEEKEFLQPSKPAAQPGPAS